MQIAYGGDDGKDRLKEELRTGDSERGLRTGTLRGLFGCQRAASQTSHLVREELLLREMLNAEC